MIVIKDVSKVLDTSRVVEVEFTDIVSHIFTQSGRGYRPPGKAVVLCHLTVIHSDLMWLLTHPDQEVPSVLFCHILLSPNHFSLPPKPRWEGQSLTVSRPSTGHSCSLHYFLLKDRVFFEAVCLEELLLWAAPLINSHASQSGGKRLYNIQPEGFICQYFPFIVILTKDKSFNCRKEILHSLKAQRYKTQERKSRTSRTGPVSTYVNKRAAKMRNAVKSQSELTKQIQQFNKGRLN